jgi:hypothetical protein
MTKEEILDGIAKTDAVINNSSIPEAVKQVAINKKAELQSKLDAMGGEAPKVEKEEVIEKEVEKEVVAPKKERIKFERKPRTPKAPKKEKEAETESPESKAEKSMEGKTLSVANCRELLAKLKTRREGAKKRVATRKKQGKPAQLTTIEVLKKASDNLEKKVETEVNKDGKLQKTTITRSTKEVVDIVATIVSGIPTKAERTSYINEVIADLKKLIDKVEPITEKMEKGGYMADGGKIEIKDSGMGSQGNYGIRLTYNPKNKLSELSITMDTSEVISFKKIPYGVIEGFANKFQDLKDEFDDDLSENNWDFSYKYASADTEMMKYGANKSGNSYVIFIGNKTKAFFPDDLMESIANAFIELYEELGESPYDDEDEYAKGGEIGQELMGGQPNQEKPSGAILLEVRKNGKEIVVTEDDGKTKELYVKSNGFSGYTLHYKGNQYEFAYSLDSYAKGGYMADGGRLSVKSKYNSVSEYANYAKEGDLVLVGRDEADLSWIGDTHLDKFVKVDDDGDVIFKHYGRKVLITYPNNYSIIVVNRKYANGGMMADGGETNKRYFLSEEDDDGYYYIMDSQTMKKVPNTLFEREDVKGWGKIKNKFIKVRRSYSRELRTIDAKHIIMILNDDNFAKGGYMADGGMNQNYEGLEIIIPSSYQNKNKLKGDIEAFIGDDYEDYGDKIFVRNKDIYGHGVTLSKLQDLYDYIENNYAQIQVEMFAKGGMMGKDASNLSEQERFELNVLKALSGWNKGLNINSLYEVLGFSNYRFNQYATDEEVYKVKNALSSLMNKGYVEDSAFGYAQTIDGREYIDSFKYGTYEDGGMMAKGGKITRNKNKNDWKGKFDFFVDNNYQPIGKRDLINMAYESSNGIDSAIPQSMVGDVDNTAYYVYDYQTDKMGELVDLRMKLKFSNVKVDVTIVQDGELKYRDELPSELQNATFHQALNYVFMNDDVEQFAIRPKK